MVAGSLGGFLGGWSLLAHAGKPVSNVAQAPVTQPTASTQGLPSLNLPSVTANNNNANIFQLLPSQSSGNASFMPRLRTRGS